MGKLVNSVKTGDGNRGIDADNTSILHGEIGNAKPVVLINKRILKQVSHANDLPFTSTHYSVWTGACQGVFFRALDGDGLVFSVPDTACPNLANKEK
ncbi:MAG: hypothetical protein LIO46_05685, partial [Clostridiales bacterium]|nr:hypothetical protein [Clostridiales bacterium]